MYLTEGEFGESQCIHLSGYPQSENLKLYFPTQNLSGARLELAEIVIRELDKELNFLDAGLYENRLKNKNWIIERQYLASSNFQARVGGKSGRYQIQLSIGAALIALSTSIELCSLQGDSQTSELANQYSESESSIEILFPGVTKLEQIDLEALGLAQDVCLLLYLHEVAHVIYGHCDYKFYNRNAGSNECRALEFDADFNAGTMFGLWVKSLPAEHRKPKGYEDFLKRIIKASFLLSTILKAVSARSANYHLPTNRMITFLSGGAFAFERTDKSPKFKSIDEGDKYWNDKILSHTASIKSALGRSSLKQFMGTERDIKIDYEEISSVTYATRNFLKDGPLMDFRLNV